MTHERISNVLGVRRESVSAAAAQLQDEGLIQYTRGTIEFLIERVCWLPRVSVTRLLRINTKGYWESISPSTTRNNTSPETLIETSGTSA